MPENDANVSMVALIAKQLQLQAEKMKDGDPRELTGDARKDFMRWNAFALEDEIHEALQEVAWKPWAKADFINREAFIREMVDAWHFFMNLLLAASPNMTPYEIAEEFCRFYYEKNAKNAQRQDEGYTGLDKCSNCHRELAELPTLPQLTVMPTKVGEPSRRFCSPRCHDEFLDKTTGVGHG